MLMDQLEEIIRNIDVNARLSDEEAGRLASLLGKGGEEEKAALDKLLRYNLRFIIWVARQYEGQGLTLGQLVEEGIKGFISAARYYPEEENNRQDNNND